MRTRRERVQNFMRQRSLELGVASIIIIVTIVAIMCLVLLIASIDWFLGTNAI